MPAVELEAPPTATPEVLPAAAPQALPADLDAPAEAELLEAVRPLWPEYQRAVLSHARALHAEQERRIEADEAKWDKLFNNPVKMANFAKWAEGVLATQESEPFDESKL